MLNMLSKLITSLMHFLYAYIVTYAHANHHYFYSRVRFPKPILLTYSKNLSSYYRFEDM